MTAFLASFSSVWRSSCSEPCTGSLARYFGESRISGGPQSRENRAGCSRLGVGKSADLPGGKALSKLACGDGMAGVASANRRRNCVGPTNRSDGTGISSASFLLTRALEKRNVRKHRFEREVGVAASPAICETAGVPGSCTPVAALPPNCAARRVGSWSRFSCYWATPRFRRPNGTWAPNRIW
jgi:hypothetical protein